MIDGTMEKYLQEGQGISDGRFLRILRATCQRLPKEDDPRQRLDLILAGVLSGMCIPKDQRGAELHSCFGTATFEEYSWEGIHHQRLTRFGSYYSVKFNRRNSGRWLITILPF